MKKTASFFIIACFALNLVLPNLALAQTGIKVAVMDLKAKSGINPMTVSSLTDLICTQISNLGGFDVMGRDDMQTMLAHIADKQLLECDDTKCLARVGGALGVQQLLAGNIGMVGNRYLINMKLIDIEQVKVIKRLSREYMGDEGGLINEIKITVASIFGKETPPATAAAPVSTPPTPQQIGQQINKELSTSAAGAGAMMDCNASMQRGIVDGARIPQEKWLAAGAGCGCLLGLIGAGLVWVMAGSGTVDNPPSIPPDVEPTCYSDGFKKQVKKNKKQKACIGGVIGAVAAGVIISAVGF